MLARGQREAKKIALFLLLRAEGLGHVYRLKGRKQADMALTARITALVKWTRMRFKR